MRGFKHTLALAGLSIATALLSVNANASPAKTIVPLATWGSSNHICIRQFVPALKKALKETQPNNIEFQLFPGGQLAQDSDMPVAIPSGRVKFGWITVNGWSGTVPATKIIGAPTGLKIGRASGRERVCQYGKITV